ncbi:MAG: radical SAM protein [Desulfobacteraceae bacterium]|nr:radical SAM protein [Desulfobacteraceae bacterium]
MKLIQPIQKLAFDTGTEALVQAWPILAKIAPLRGAATLAGETYARLSQKRPRTKVRYPPGVVNDRFQMGKAIRYTAKRLVKYKPSLAVRRAVINNLVRGILVEGVDRSAAEQFRAKHGTYSPGFLTISPGKACNLRCVGCYADSGTTNEKLDWSTFDRILTEARTLWGIYFIVISGGEPLAYRSEGKGILDAAEKHPDIFFLMYTNGTLINDRVAARMAKVGNITPALSVEGWRERTDARRGSGVFDKVLAAMERLRSVGVPFGISLTATRDNVEEILSDEFIDFFFEQQGAMYGWIFHYMPIGRAFTLNLMPTPRQRLWMWRRSWEIIHQRRLFLADFWNHGTLSDGCISAGRSTGGGYLYIDWNGAVSPCVFVPYSPVNVKEIYARGGTLDDIWAEPFFAGLRNWQDQYRNGEGQPGNWLMPCPIRDHHREFRRLLAQYKPVPTDENARDALLDENYARGMTEYDAAYQALSGPIWIERYLRPDHKLRYGEVPPWSEAPNSGRENPGGCI